MSSQEIIELLSSDEDEVVGRHMDPYTYSDDDGPHFQSMSVDSDEELPSTADLLNAPDMHAWRSSPALPSSSQTVPSQATATWNWAGPSSSQTSSVNLARSSSRSSLLSALDNLPSLAGRGGSNSSGSRKRKRADDQDESSQSSRQSKAKEREEAAAQRKALRDQKTVDKHIEEMRKKEQKAKEKAEKDAAKARLKAEKEKEQEIKKLNNLVSDKKTTLVDLTVEISRELGTHAAFRGKLRALERIIVENSGQAAIPGSWPVTFFDEEFLNLIRWRRKIIAKYNEATRLWDPVEEHRKLEKAQMLFLPAELFYESMKNGKLEGSLLKLRGDIGQKAQIFLMLEGVGKKKAVELFLSRLEVQHRVYIIRVDSDLDFATWIYDMTADLGIKPHQLIKKSHLSFCADIKVKCGTSASDTYYKMLQQVPRITESAATAIMRVYPTLRSLLEAYDAGGGEHLLDDIQISHTKSGQDRQRNKLGPKLSQRVFRILTSDDSLELVGPE